jgi:hypothetical protein
VRGGELARDFIPDRAVPGEAVKKEDRLLMRFPAGVGDDEIAIDGDPIRPHAASSAGSGVLVHHPCAT